MTVYDKKYKLAPEKRCRTAFRKALVAGEGAKSRMKISGVKSATHWGV
jgi:hypothetical protein